MRGVVVAALLVLGGLAGCIGTDAGDVEPTAVGEPAAADEGEGPHEDVHAGYWTASLRASAATNTFVGSRPPVVPFGGHVTGVVVEMRWEPATPLSEEMQLEVRNGLTGDLVAVEQGPPPVRVAIADEDTPAAELVLRARPASDPGVWVDQEHEFWTAVFRGVPFDPTHEFSS